MRQVTVATLITLALAAGCGTPSSTAIKTENSAAPAPGAGSTPGSSTAAPAPDPKGRVTGSCDDLLGNIDANTGSMAIWFIGDVTIRNTGNIAYHANAKVVFGQVGGAPVVAVKHVRVAVGRTKTVHFKIPVTQTQEDQYQAEADYGAGSCRIQGTIMRTYGSTR